MIKRLYKYFSVNEYSVDSLKKRSLWYNVPSGLNDPFELKLMHPNELQTIKGLLNARADNPHLHYLTDEEFLERLLFAYQSDFNKYGVTCFSEEPDNILMWAHYANSHTGFCLGFDFKINDGVYPVGYSNEYPKLDFERVNHVDGLMKILLTKSKQWEYEKEWRAIRFPEPQTYPSLVPYYGELREVIFGAKITEDHKVLLKSCLQEPDIIYKSCYCHPSEYSLVIMDVN